MLAGRGKLASSRLAGVLASVAGGALIGFFTTVVVSAFPWTITVLIFLGLLTIVPAFLLHDAAPYWLSVYLIGLPLEAGKRITNLGHSSQDILTTIGLPPSGDLGVKLYPADLALLALLIPWVADLATGASGSTSPASAMHCSPTCSGRASRPSSRRNTSP
jgi:hypothetical protein